MSTRATVHFIDEGCKKPSAIVYRHGDGYLEGLGKDLQEFIKAVRKLPDKRLDDASYLAAKWVVFDAAQMAGEGNPNGGPEDRLNFLSVGIVNADPLDIEYRYKVVCDGKPTITVERVIQTWRDDVDPSYQQIGSLAEALTA